MELKKGEDVEKINSSQRMGPERKRRQVACSWDYVPGPRVGWDCIKEWCGKEASMGSAGMPKTE